MQVTRKNHPGALDPHNPGFASNLEAARRHGLALADRVTDASGYMAALLGFKVRIGDGHAGMISRLDEASLPRAASCSAATARRPGSSSGTTCSVSRPA